MAPAWLKSLPQAARSTAALERPASAGPVARSGWGRRLAGFPWWALALGLILLGAGLQILLRPSYREAFPLIAAGMGVTLLITLVAYAAALAVGLAAGFGRISANPVARNAATLYVELVRGIPMLVLIFFIALVGVPGLVGGLNRLGEGLAAAGLPGGGALAALSIRSVPMEARAVIALAVTYGAFQTEIVRAGIESVDRGQMEAARSQGLSYFQAMRFVILPQAIRNILPALGNEFVSLLKDSSLVSVLAVRDITQIAKLYAGQSFRYEEAYVTLAGLYLCLTLGLSLLMKWVERRVRHGSH